MSVRRCPAHPRSRGENLVDSLYGVLRAGSSPLTRGKPRQNRGRSLVPGLIPAHAGKTPALPRLQRPGEAHPRSRGENFRMGGGGHFRSGSSPLTRGKHISARLDALDEGLIPAHAGKTRPSSDSSPDHRAHPRSRGENRAAISTRLRQCGSSPLTRGKRLLVLVGAVVERLIPAHAGKTFAWVVGGIFARAHPRSRGENRSRGPILGAARGSSPLTRGKRPLDRPRPAAGRLIPAHAGKT